MISGGMIKRTNKPKDFRLKITVKNDRLLTLIEEKFGTQAEMCRAANLFAPKLSALVTMRETPTCKKGWTEFAEDVASALGVYPSDIWPDHMRDVRLATRTASISLNANELPSISNDSDIDAVMISDLIEKGRVNLSKRESAFLDWIMHNNFNATLEEKGEALGVSTERARVIECKMMHKMRLRLMKKHGVDSIST